MIKLALAIGFLSVFGLVAYFGIVTVVQHFNKNSKQNKNKTTN